MLKNQPQNSISLDIQSVWCHSNQCWASLRLLKPIPLLLVHTPATPAECCSMLLLQMYSMLLLNPICWWCGQIGQDHALLTLHMVFNLPYGIRKVYETIFYVFQNIILLVESNFPILNFLKRRKHLNHIFITCFISAQKHIKVGFISVLL